MPLGNNLSLWSCISTSWIELSFHLCSVLRSSVPKLESTSRKQGIYVLQKYKIIFYFKIHSLILSQHFIEHYFDSCSLEVIGYYAVIHNI